MPDMIILVEYKQNKPAAQAAGADPFRCNSTNRQNPPIQQNGHIFWTSNAIWKPLKIYNFQKLDRVNPVDNRPSTN